MPLSSPPILLVPGARRPGPGHWMDTWAQRLPGTTLVTFSEAPSLQRARWVDHLASRIRVMPEPPVIVAHDLGCLAAVHLPPDAAARVRSALLVAPRDPARRAVTDNFAPVPCQPLSYPSIVVASNDDPACSLRLASAFARSWRSEFLRLQDAGHLDEAADLADWPLGRALLQALSDAPR